MNDENQNAEKPSTVSVTCDVCGMESEGPADDFFTRCKNKNGECFNTLLLYPANENIKYIQVVCESTVRTFCVPISSTTFTCPNKRVHTIDNVVAEVRCNQVVYNARQVLPIHVELNQLREKFEKSEEHNKKNLEELAKLLEENKNLLAADKTKTDEMKKTMLERDEEKKKRMEAEERLRKLENELENAKDRERKNAEKSLEDFRDMFKIMRRGIELSSETTERK